MSNPIVTIEMENGKKIVAELYPTSLLRACGISSPSPTPVFITA